MTPIHRKWRKVKFFRMNVTYMRFLTNTQYYSIYCSCHFNFLLDGENSLFQLLLFGIVALLIMSTVIALSFPLTLSS